MVLLLSFLLVLTFAIIFSSIAVALSLAVLPRIRGWYDVGLGGVAETGLMGVQRSDYPLSLDHEYVSLRGARFKGVSNGAACICLLITSGIS